MEELTTISMDKNELAELNVGEELKKQANELLKQAVVESDYDKQKDIANLFNMNQNKKTMVRMGKLNELLDTITDQALNRFANRPDNISNKELLDGMRVVQDMLDRGQKNVAGVNDAPLIQINQQNNEVNLGSIGSPSRESREKIKEAVMALISGMGASSANETSQAIDEPNEDVIVEEVEEDD